MGSREMRSMTVLLTLHKGWKHSRNLLELCHAALVMEA